MRTRTIKPSQRGAKPFIDALGKLDAGGRARLRRNAGRTLAEARDTYRVFFQALPPDLVGQLDEQEQEDYFLIATLFPLVPHGLQTRNLGETLQRVRQLRQARQLRDGGSGQLTSMDRRIEMLLDSDREQLPFRLRQAIRLVAAQREGLTINWEQLLRHVLRWEQRTEQPRWAESYYGVIDTPSDDE